MVGRAPHRRYVREFVLALWWLVPFAPSTQTFLRVMDVSLAPSTSVLRGGWRFSLVPPMPLLLPGRGGSLSSLRRLLDYGERRLTQLLDADLEPIGLGEFDVDKRFLDVRRLCKLGAPALNGVGVDLRRWHRSGRDRFHVVCGRLR
ncbi:hypothetical protein F2Q69_00026143 [Brassica cretica]|uniref:Secreted protein n=1 Tax=Brassica cretica TaxID=69181 RepID=A0A8S9S7Z8_BRACR|nr:hypothetical protein F2Q69_00026143 [Brassica cretica]